MTHSGAGDGINGFINGYCVSMKVKQTPPSVSCQASSRLLDRMANPLDPFHSFNI